MAKMEVTIIPGNAGAQESQYHGEKQKLRPGLEEPNFQLHESLSITNRLIACLHLSGGR
jgi:hypothetical protein